MKALVRFGIAATLALTPSALWAQDIVTPTGNTVGAVGPAQLKDFSLSGEVVRRAEPAQERSEPAAASPQPQQQQQQRVQANNGSSAPPQPRQQAQAAPTREAAPRLAERSADASSSGASSATAPVRAPAPSSVTRAAALNWPPPSPADPLYSPLPAAGRAPASEPSPLASAQTLPWDDGFSPLPWVVALLLAGGAAAFYLRRQRSELAFAGPGSELDEPAPQQPLRRAPARPAAPAAAPSPAPVPPAARPVGIVSARLRPWLDLQLTPDRLALEQDRATLEFDITVFNSGSGPARDVLVEGMMFNAGPEQDKEIGAFFANPVGKGDRVAVIEPLNSLRLRSAVSLPRDQLRQFKAGEHLVFVPIIAFNALYRWSGGECQTSNCVLIGRQTKSEKLAPFRFEQDARLFTGLGGRQLDLNVRK